MFMAVAEEFFAILGGAEAKPCTIQDGLGVMTMLDAARQSHAEGRRIKLD